MIGCPLRGTWMVPFAVPWDGISAGPAMAQGRPLQPQSDTVGFPRHDIFARLQRRYRLLVEMMSVGAEHDAERSARRRRSGGEAGLRAKPRLRGRKRHLVFRREGAPIESAELGARVGRAA